MCISESNDGCGPLDNVLSGRVSEQSAGCKINEGTVTEEEKELVKKPCEFCGKKFADGGALKRHLKSHMGIKDYACTECGNAYSEKRARDNHYNIVHLGVKNFPCEQCGKMFGRSSALHVHMTKIHPHAIVKEGERKLEIPATYPALSMIPAPAADSDREPHPHPP